MQTIQAHKSLCELPEKLIHCLPLHLTDAIRRCGAERAEEIRMHRDRLATVSSMGRNYSTNIILSEHEINDILNRMCGGSLYAHRHTISQGYLALGHGVRVGICGSAALDGDAIIGVSDISGLIVRIPHRHSVDVRPILDPLRKNGIKSGILLYSPPGKGKTTVLRNVAIAASSGINALRTVVVDSREELGFTLDGQELSLDLLIGYPKERGIEIAVRNLGAELVICDEIGSMSDARAVLSASNCGVPLIASAHAASVSELLRRPSIRLLHRAHAFGTYVGLTRDASGIRFAITDHKAAEREWQATNGYNEYNG